MNSDVYATALRNSLEEIMKICPDVNCSFIFSKEGSMLAEDKHCDPTVLEKVMPSLQNIVEKATVAGGLNTLLINGENGKMYISFANDVYLALVTSDNADITYLRSVTSVVIPTIFKLLKNIVPTAQKPGNPAPAHHTLSSQQLTVNIFGGLRTRFSSHIVEIDKEILEQWPDFSNGKQVETVIIEAFGGDMTLSKVKAIKNPQLKGKGLIRIPEGICRALHVKNGELVKVRPSEPEEPKTLK